jgi:putative flippase GtrA
MAKSLASRFVVFNAVAMLGVAVQLGSIALLTEVANVHYLPATAIAVAAAVLHNFLWHRRWTWADRRVPALRSLRRFALTNGVVSLAGNLGVMATLVSGAHVPPIPANVVAIALCGLLNFWLGDTFVFSE